MTHHDKPEEHTDHDEASDDASQGGQVAEQGPVPTTPENASDTGPAGEDVAPAASPRTEDDDA